MSYKVKLDLFEGPFDLLVYLIEHAEMNIYDIQIAQITSQYLDYIKRLQDISVEVATEFMVLAATLLEIKSKMLLPGWKKEGDGTISEDPRTELVQRILEYKRFKAAAEQLSEQEDLASRILSKPKEDLAPFTKEFEVLDLDLDQFVKAFNAFLQKKKNLDEIQKNYVRVQRDHQTLERKLEQIQKRFALQKRLTFEELMEPDADRFEIVLTFVALLELIRQNQIRFLQDTTFGEIRLVRTDQKNIETEAERRTAQS